MFGKFALRFALVFFFFLFVGCLYYKEALNVLLPSLDTLFNTVEKVEGAVQQPIVGKTLLALVIFAKNMLVVILIVTFGNRLSGAFSYFVLAQNGALLGAVAGSMVSIGVPLGTTISCFAPHGIIEIPTLIAACALAAGWKSIGFKERLRKGALYLSGPLAMAALVEVFVTPWVMSS